MHGPLNVKVVYPVGLISWRTEVRSGIVF